MAGVLQLFKHGHHVLCDGAVLLFGAASHADAAGNLSVHKKGVAAAHSLSHNSSVKIMAESS